MAKTTIGKNINLDEEEVVLKHGRYTEADAAADAAEFENRPGRPSSSSAERGPTERPGAAAPV